MPRFVPCLALVAIALVAPHPSAAAAPAPAHSHHAMHLAPVASHFDNLGPHRHAIRTKSPEAQRYFNDGLNWMWAFNLQEAQHSFQAATKLDSSCAMAWWGVALSLGPHINVPAIPERTVEAEHAVQRAQALEQNASDEESALIEALAHRYADPAPADPAAQAKLDQGYADAMREVAKKYPDDLDVQALCVESLLDLRPWDYWTLDGAAQPGTDEIVSRLEAILRRDPTHPGANHYYIHAVEASGHPERALGAAHRLETLMPGAGHMVHMPFHIYLRVGQYARAEKANQHATDEDLKYQRHVGELPMFMHMYFSHDFQSLGFCQMMQGKSAAALHNAAIPQQWISPEMAQMMPGVDFFLASADLMRARFGRWDAILSSPPPPAGLPFLGAIRHYVRGLALAAKGRYREAQAARDSVNAIAAALPADMLEDLNPAKTLLDLASHSLAGEIAAREGKVDGAVAELSRAAAIEDSLHYSEPPDWPNPVRLSLGQVLLDAGRARQAEAEYRKELAAHAHDPWGVHGLAASLQAQHRGAEAAPLEAEFNAAWAGADLKLKGTRF